MIYISVGSHDWPFRERGLLILDSFLIGTRELVTNWDVACLPFHLFYNSFFDLGLRGNGVAWHWGSFSFSF